MKDSRGPCHNGLSQIFPPAAVGVARLIALAAALSVGPPAIADEATNDSGQGVLTDAAMTPHRDAPPAEPIPEPQGSVDGDSAGRLFSEPATANTGADQSAKERAPDDLTKGKMAQFQWPPRPTRPAPQEQPAQKEPPGPQEQYTPELGAPARPVTQFLKYQYSYGSESEIVYRRDPDLNYKVKDNYLFLTPQVNGMILYRPTPWVETLLEMILDREMAVREEDRVTLPGGQVQVDSERYLSLRVDQAFVTLKSSSVPMEFTLGRRNYEDERHWLYDTSMDVIRAQLKLGQFRIEGTFGREVWVDGDLLHRQVPDHINTLMLYMEYRGIEDTKLALYTIGRNDRSTPTQEGRPVHIGGRALGTPSDDFNYWIDLAYLGGRDELSQKISAAGFDVGGTYQFRKLPFSPSFTLGYALGTGDGNPNDKRNHEFRQTGLQSNEWKFAGISKFKYYGEGFDPELSNLKIITMGFGFRPRPTVSVDLVYHRYRLHKMADKIRNSALTAEINQDDTQLSRDMGHGFDIVMGIRNLFGVRRLGLDLRVGWYFPGKAYRIEEGTSSNPTFRSADNGIGAVAKIWY